MKSASRYKEGLKGGTTHIREGQTEDLEITLPWRGSGGSFQITLAWYFSQGEGKNKACDFCGKK